MCVCVCVHQIQFDVLLQVSALVDWSAYPPTKSVHNLGRGHPIVLKYNIKMKYLLHLTQLSFYFIISFVGFLCFIESGGWRSVWYFYFGVIWSWVLLETVTIEVGVSTAFHDLAF